jgi:hypothetical protein
VRVGQVLDSNCTDMLPCSFKPVTRTLGREGQTPLYEQVGQLEQHQQTCWALARPAPNKLYNLLGVGLARAKHLDMSRCWSFQSTTSWLSVYQPTSCTSSCLVHRTRTRWSTCCQLVRIVEFGHYYAKLHPARMLIAAIPLASVCH